MRTREQVEFEVKDIILKYLKIDNHTIADNAELFSLGLDSLNTIPLILDVEETFELEFEMGELSYQSFKSIADISTLVFNKMSSMALKNEESK